MDERWLQDVLAGLVLGHLLCRRLPDWLQRAGLTRRNYRGETIPTGGGLLFCSVVLVEFVRGLNPLDLLLFFPIFGFGLLGLIDDVWGSAEVKGVRGHLLALLRRRVTSGSVKLIGGILLSWWLCGLISPGLLQPISTLLIALSANTLNLLDLRPLRALKGFWLGLALVPGIGHWMAVSSALAFLVGLTVPFARQEARRNLMLGDTGANLLGGLLGTIAVLQSPWYAQVGVVLVLGAFHFWAERNSLTKWIEARPWARWLDRLGTGVFEPPWGDR